jgi:hypothetical protein
MRKLKLSEILKFIYVDNCQKKMKLLFVYFSAIFITTFVTECKNNNFILFMMCLIYESVSVDEFLPIKAHLNKRGRLIHHCNKYDT